MVAAAKTRQWRRCGPQDLYGALSYGGMLPRRVRENLSRLARLLLGAGMHPCSHQPRKRRISNLPTVFDLLGVETLVVVRRGESHGRVIGLEGLQDHLTGGLRSPRPTRHLGQQLKGALRGPKVRKRKTLVGQHDAHERHGRNVVPLGYHLSTHQDVDLSSSQAIEHGLHTLTGSRVTIEPGDTSLWETLLDTLL